MMGKHGLRVAALALLCLAPLGLMPSPASAAATLVQQKTGNGNPVSSLPVTLTSTPGTGNVLIMVGANWNGALLAPNATPTPGVTGGGVTSWSRAAYSPTNTNIEIWYGVVDTTPSTTVTATQCNTPCAGGGMWMSVSEWSGLIGTQSQLLDQAAAIGGTTSLASAGPITTTNANDLLIFGVADASGNTWGTPSPGTWTAMTAITTPAAQKSWYRVVSATGTYNPSVSVTQLAWDAAIAAFKYCSVADASYVVANAQNGQVTVYWGSPNWVVILRDTNTFTTQIPTSPGTATTVYKGSAGSFTQSVTNGTTYYYKVFTQCGPPSSSSSFSSGISVSTTPSTAPPVWSYATTATTLAAPGLDDNNVVVWGGNDNDIHGANASNGALAFPPVTTPTGAIQARPTIIPAAYSATGVTVAYVVSQDGYVYAINTSTGGQVWKSTVPGSSLLQGGAAVWLKAIAPSVQICGAITDVVFVGTRDTVNRTMNSVYALNGGTTNVTSTGGGNCRANGTNVVPGDYLWKFTGSGTNPSMDYISSTPYVDYTNQVVWVTSRAQGSGTAQPSLWKFNVTNGMLFNGTTSCGSGATQSCWTLGDIDYSPTPSFDGAWIYVGTNSGTPSATIKAIQGGTIISLSPGGIGNVKGPYPLSLASSGSTTTITPVNSTKTVQSSASTQCVMTLSPMTAGNTNVVIVATPNIAVTSITDSRGSTYSLRTYATNTTPNPALRVEIWTATIASGSGTTVTVTLQSSATSVCAVAQYSGVAAVGNDSSWSAQNSKNPTMTLVTWDNNNYVVAGYAIASSTAPTANTGNLRQSGAVTGVAGALNDNTLATAGTVTNAVSTSSKLNWAGVEVQLRAKTVDPIIVTQDTQVTLVQFNGSQFNTIWWTTNSFNVSAPVDDGAGNIYIGGSDGKVHQFDVETGTDLKQVAIPGSTPTVGDPSFDAVLNRIYVGASDGRVYAIGTPF